MRFQGLRVHGVCKTNISYLVGGFSPTENMKVNGKDDTFFHFRVAARYSAWSLPCKSETKLIVVGLPVVVRLHKTLGCEALHDKIGKGVRQYGCCLNAPKSTADE